MSQENVELAKRFNEAGRHGDVEAAFFQFVAEDVVATDFGDSVDTPNVVRGRNALHDAYRQVAEILDDYYREVDEYVEVGDWVIAVGRWVGTGKASGVPVERRGTNAGRWREGKIVEWLFGLDSKEAALEAVESRGWAMSQKNVEAYKRAVEAANRRDLEAMLEEFDPEVEWYSAVVGMGTEVYRGAEGIREMFRDADETIPDALFEVSEIRDLGDRLLAFGRLRAHGSESGAPTEVPFNQLVQFRDGKATVLRTYLDRKDALEAAGLREEAISQENVEIVRRGYESWNRDDMESGLRDLDPEIEWRPRLGTAGVRATVYHGHEGVLAYKREVEEALGPIRVDVLAIEDLGGVNVLAHIRATGQGSASGARVEAEGFHLWTMRAGRAVRFATYERRDEALKAAGLK